MQNLEILRDSNPANDSSTDHTSDTTSIDLEQSGSNFECQAVPEPRDATTDKSITSPHSYSEIDGLVQSDYFKNMEFDRLQLNDALERTYAETLPKLRHEGNQANAKHILRKHHKYCDINYIFARNI